MKIYLDIQIIDINTCTPIPNAAIEIWGANSSVSAATACSILKLIGHVQGIYSGVAGFDTTDPRNVNSKALRGIQISGKDGEVQFETIIPGNYFGRTNHLHGETFPKA